SCKSSINSSYSARGMITAVGLPFFTMYSAFGFSVFMAAGYSVDHGFASPHPRSRENRPRVAIQLAVRASQRCSFDVDESAQHEIDGKRDGETDKPRVVVRADEERMH